MHQTAMLEPLLGSAPPLPRLRELLLDDCSGLEGEQLVQMARLFGDSLTFLDISNCREAITNRWNMCCGRCS